MSGKGHEQFKKDLKIVLREIEELLVSKNAKYGNSAVEPIGIFAKGSAIELIDARIDDKLTRIRNSHVEEDEDLEKDLIGYLIIKEIAKMTLAREEASKRPYPHLTEQH